VAERQVSIETGSVSTDTGAFVQVPIWVLDAVGPGARDLYATLLRYADRNGSATPSRTRLARHMGCGIKTVDRRVKELVAAGALIVRPRYDEAGDRTSNEWVALRVRGGGVTSEPTVASPVTQELDLSELETLSVSNETSSARATKEQVQELWDALEDEHIVAPLAKSQRAAFAKTVRELWDVGATPADVHRWAKAYRRDPLFRDARLTVHALAKWAQQLDADNGPLRMNVPPPCVLCGVGAGLHIEGCAAA
jgi:helix-turn-helix protein